MPKRNKFNLSHQINTTFDMGQLIPIGVMEVLPGDVFNHKVSAFLRAAPTDLPIMHPTHVDIRTFFVPNRLIWFGFEEFITGGDVTWPHINYDKVDESSLEDYLGLPVGDYTQSGKSQNALPVRAYNLIYNEWFRDEQEGAPAVIDTGSGTDSTTDTDVQRAAWRKDRFTSARTSPQVGDAVPIPIDVEITASTSVTQPVLETNGAFTVSFGGSTRTIQGVGSGPQAVFNENAPNNENAAYSSGLSLTDTGVDVTLTGEDSVAITVEQLRRSLALQRFGERLNRHGSRYTEYLRSQGIRSSDARLDRPEYLGGGTQVVQWDEVLQSFPTDASTSQAGLGAYAGHGIGAMRSNRYVRHFNEHGILMTLMTVRPTTMYTQGAAAMWFRDTYDKYFQPELQHLGMQPVIIGEIDQINCADQRTVFGYQDAYDEYRHQPSYVSGKMNSTEKAFHFGREFSSEPSLNQSFILCEPRSDPFQIQTESQFRAMIRHDLRARRMLRRAGTPITM